MQDNEKFHAICDLVVNSVTSRDGIGTLSEKTLHSVLKNYYEPDEKKQEIKVGAKVADILNEVGIMEIQTRQFNKLRGKLEIFLEQYPVTIVYPIPSTKWLCWIDETTGEVSPRRKSPKRGKPHQIFVELYKIKPFLRHPNLNFKIAMVEVEEYRFLNGWSHDKKKGSSCSDRIPIDLDQEISLDKVEDYTVFLPVDLPEQFTTKDYAKCAKISTTLSQVGINVMCSVGAIEMIGKKGRLKLYQRSI